MNETWYAEQHPDGDWRVFDRGTGTHGRDRLVAEDLTESDAKRIIADHTLAQWAREHGQPALERAKKRFAGATAPYLDSALAEYAKLSQPESAEGTGR